MREKQEEKSRSFFALGRLVNRYKSLSIQARASFWFLTCAFLQKGLSVLTTPIFVRLMSTEEYGKFGVFNSWFGIISVFVTLNLFSGVYAQGLVKFSHDRRVFSSSLEGLVFTLTTVYTGIYVLFHSYINDLIHLTTVQMLAMLLLIWTSAVFNLWAEEKRVEYKYKIIVAVSLLLSFSKPVLGVILVVLSEDKVTARILGMALIDIIVCSALFILQMKRGRSFYSKRYWRYALKFNIPLIPHYLSATVLSSADRIMIENITGSGDAGVYNLAYSIALIMTIFNTALQQTISPWFYQQIKEKKVEKVERIGYTTLILIGTVNLLLILFAPEIIYVYAPPEYASAVWVIPPVVMSVFFMFSYDLFAKFAFYYERTIIIMIASVTGATLNIILNLIAIPLFGFIAAGYTTLICYILYAVAHYWFMRKVCRENCNGIMPYKTGTILKISMIFLLFGFLFLLTYLNMWVRYGLIALLLIAGVLLREKLMTAIQSVLSLKKNTNNSAEKTAE